MLPSSPAPDAHSPDARQRADVVPAGGPRLGRWLDSVGSIGAIVCALHCALLPLVIAVLPALGLSLVWSHELELGYVAFATLLALVSLWHGYRRHRFYHALALLVPGLIAVWSGMMIPGLHETVSAHAITMAAGGSLIAVAHLVNLRLSSRHEQEHVHGAHCAHVH